jgi:hypothetical protein
MDWIYDLETYKNIFTFTAIDVDGNNPVTFEMSTRKNEAAQMFAFLDTCKKKKSHLIGFNNLGFDYPIVHDLLSVREKALTVSGKAVAVRAYKKAQAIITNQDKFVDVVYDREQYVKQIDLYKIHHFDNKARATSLKMIEFNMKSDTIEDLPFPVGTDLTEDQMDVLINYNMHDVVKTLDFYKESLHLINFRAELSKKYKRNFLNHNDTKIGKDYFIMQLEENMPGCCYKVGNKGERKINQTKRDVIHIKDCLFNYYDFQHPAFQAVLDWFKQQSITETKGVFSAIPEDKLGKVAMFANMITLRKKFVGVPTDEDIAEFKAEYPLGWVEQVELKAKKKGVAQYSHWKHWNEASTLNVNINGFQFDFGTGGIHGSVESKIITSDDDYMIIDADVASMYPNIAIANRVYPKHLGEKFCDIYQDVYNQRKSYPKGSAENAMLKLALNGVYGDSNNQFSPFYDPQYTMSITINGQLSLCLLAEKLLHIDNLSIVQVNTDGITVKLPRDKLVEYETICAAWQKQVGLELEYAYYSKMIIRDVNNYIALYANGKVKRKGAYQYEDLGWHQDQGGLVIPKAAESYMLHGIDIDTYIKGHQNNYDFLLRTKVPRSSRLVMVMSDGREVLQQNICRYYASTAGADLIKIMPPLVVDGEERRMDVESGWKTWACNNIEDFSRDDLDYSFYTAAAKKLVVE